MWRAMALVLATAVVLGVLGLAACGKRADPDAPLARRIGTLAIVDVPPTWEVSTIGKDAYRVGEGPGEQVFVRAIAFPPPTLDELYATECARAPSPGTKATTHAGAMLVECRLASMAKDGTSIDLLHVVSLIHLGDRGIKCHFGLPGDAADAAAVCRSLRR